MEFLSPALHFLIRVSILHNITFFLKMNKFKIFIFFSFFAVFFSCGKVGDDRPQIPYAGVNRQINLNDPLYSDLKTMGGHINLDNDGARGVIVVHDYLDQFYALERNCPFNSQDQCARVTMEKNRVSIRCGSYNNGDWVPCCNSKFNLDGSVLEGPSRYGLYRYNVAKSGDMLIISN